MASGLVGLGANREKKGGAGTRCARRVSLAFSVAAPWIYGGGGGDRVGPRSRVTRRRGPARRLHSLLPVEKG